MVITILMWVGSSPPANKSCEAVKEEKFPHTRKPLHWERWEVGRGEGSETRRRVQQQGCRGQSREIPAKRTGADQHSPA